MKITIPQSIDAPVVIEPEPIVRWGKAKGPSGRAFNVRLVLREARSPAVEGGDTLAPAEFAITVSVAPIDRRGKVLRDSGDRPIVSDSTTRMLNAEAMRADDFDPEAVVAAIVDEMVAVADRKFDGVAAIKAFVKNWGEP